jgi:hypothetical protein
MRRLVVTLVIGVCGLGSGGCSPSRAPAAPAIGDACLVGRWILDQENNRSGWSYSNIPVSVSGLHGAALTLAADGTEIESFAESDPLVGTLKGGRPLAITVRGSFTFHVHADGHQYVETGAITTLPVTATLAGVAISNYHGAYTPGKGTYACSQRTLTTTTSSGVQTDSWSRK